MPRPTKGRRRRRGRERRKEFETRWRLGEFDGRWQAVIGRVSGQGYKAHLHRPANRFVGTDSTVCQRESRVHRVRPNPFSDDDQRYLGYGVASSVCKQCVTMAMQILDIESRWSRDA